MQQLISFKKQQTKEILNLIGVKVEKRDDNIEVPLDKEGRQAECESCHRRLTTDNIGNIAKGSVKLFCDNPYCFTSHIVKKLEWLNSVA